SPISRPELVLKEQSSAWASIRECPLGRNRGVGSLRDSRAAEEAARSNVDLTSAGTHALATEAGRPLGYAGFRECQLSKSGVCCCFCAPSRKLVVCFQRLVVRFV